MEESSERAITGSELAAAAELIKNHAEAQCDKCQLAQDLLQKAVQKGIQWSDSEWDKQVDFAGKLNTITGDGFHIAYFDDVELQIIAESDLDVHPMVVAMRMVDDCLLVETADSSILFNFPVANYSEWIYAEAHWPVRVMLASAKRVKQSLETPMKK